ncbi:NFIL3 like protein isoform X1 [Loxodonta africana]|uniref:NFIL3 like protein isoform X1 n=1 Tax=Loxodonta africana TaxID=9785 RepID=UPI000C813707|nr:uncharacterized protein LOC111748362 [Loxodonta africana]XP_023396281.1 uncharacterized protein LOC111748362 [Loxodonta africana]
MDMGPLDLADILQGRSKTLRGARGRGPTVRRQREFMPEEKKDTIYWEKRRKNNEAAKRSREKRRLNDAAIEGRLAALLEENTLLRAELRALKLHFGLLPPIRGPQTLPLPALLWESPWTGDPHPGAEQLPPLPGSHGCLLRPCSLDAGAPGCRGCLVAHRWMGLATPPRPPQEPVPHPPNGIDLALQAALPAALLSYRLLDGSWNRIGIIYSLDKLFLSSYYVSRSNWMRENMFQTEGFAERGSLHKCIEDSHVDYSPSSSWQPSTWLPDATSHLGVRVSLWLCHDAWGLDFRTLCNFM